MENENINTSSFAPQSGASEDKPEPTKPAETTETPNPPDPLYQGGETTPASTPEPIPAPPSSPIIEPAPVQQAQGEPSPIKNLLLKAKEMIQFRKRKKLEKILELAREKLKITNNDVQKLLRISDATATRYLSQLVREGKLRRSGTPERARYEPL